MLSKAVAQQIHRARPHNCRQQLRGSGRRACGRTHIASGIGMSAAATSSTSSVSVVLRVPSPRYDENSRSVGRPLACRLPPPLGALGMLKPLQQSQMWASTSLWRLLSCAMRGVLYMRSGIELSWVCTTPKLQPL